MSINAYGNPEEFQKLQHNINFSDKKEKLIEQLKLLKDLAPEYAELEAANLLLEYINDVEVTAAYVEIDRWNTAP